MTRRPWQGNPSTMRAADVLEPTNRASSRCSRTNQPTVRATDVLEATIHTSNRCSGTNQPYEQLKFSNMFSRPTIDWEINIKSQRISRQQAPFSFPSLLLPLLSFFFRGGVGGVGGMRLGMGRWEVMVEGIGGEHFVFSKMGIFLEGIFFSPRIPEANCNRAALPNSVN